MKIDTNTKRTMAGIAGISLSFPQPFTEGYVLLANEADAMNSLLIQNIRNNIVSKRDAAAKKGEAWDDAKMQQMIDEYALTYQFNARSAGRSTDPVEKKLYEFAEPKVKDLLKAAGYKLNTVTGEQMDELVEQYIKRDDETNGGALRKLAEKQVRDEAKIATQSLDLSVLKK